MIAALEVPDALPGLEVEVLPQRLPLEWHHQKRGTGFIGVKII